MFKQVIVTIYAEMEVRGSKDSGLDMKIKIMNH